MAMNLTEFQVISEYFQSASTKDDVLLGIGDDAAIIKPPPGHKLVVSTDTLLESVHFPANAPAGLVAQKALRANLSDMAAMAATPRWFSLALTLPKTDSDWLKSFSQGLLQDAEQYGCSLIGGDTTKGPLNIGIQIMGTLEEDARALTRSGARPDDVLMVSGTLGDAAGALYYLDSLNNPNNPDIHQDTRHLHNRYWLPEPRVTFAKKAAPLIHAACDISDGLVADVGHICTASDLGVRIQSEKLPISLALQNIHGTAAISKALTGGDDYELCMAVPPENIDEIQQIAQELEMPITQVGVFTKGETGVHCLDENGTAVEYTSAGYEHFQ